MVVNESVVAIWYVDFANPTDLICVLEQHEDHYTLHFMIREYDAAGEIKDGHSMKARRPLIPLSAAIAHVRRYVNGVVSDVKTGGVLGQWEALRGGRTLEEYSELLSSMPNAVAREVPAEQAEAIDRELQQRKRR